MTTQEVLNLSLKGLKQLNNRELREAVSVLRSTSRKRYERLIESDIDSPALRGIWGNIGVSDIPLNTTPFPTIRGMDEIELYNEFKRYRGFLTNKTSTVGGARKARTHLQETVTEITGVELTDSETTEMLLAYERAKQTGIGNIFNYKQIMSTTATVYEEHPEYTEGEVVAEVERRLQELYDENEQQPIATYPSRAL